MDPSKDYYAILGVLPSVDDAVLQAVYRALAKKYHPDVAVEPGSGSRLFIEIQEAYEILKNPVTRSRYDELRQGQHEQAGRFDQASDDQAPEGSTSDDTDDAWTIIREYEPRVAWEENRLRHLSESLALIFRTILIRNRDFKSAPRISSQLEEEFLSTYFGDSKKIQDFARFLLTSGKSKIKRDAARELNRVIRALRNPSDPDGVIRRINEKFGLHEVKAPAQTARTTRAQIPNTRDGWETVTKIAEMRGWRCTVGLFSVTYVNEAAKLKVKAATPEEAWIKMGFDP